MKDDGVTFYKCFCFSAVFEQSFNFDTSLLLTMCNCVLERPCFLVANQSIFWVDLDPLDEVDHE